MPIIGYFKSADLDDWESVFPQKLITAINKLIYDKKFKMEDISYFCVNYSSTIFKQKFFNNMGQKYARFNMVFHPYFMDYLKPGAYEEKKWIVASLYTKDDLEYGLKRSNFNPITINSVDLFSKENWVELHIHRADWNDENAMAVSPNNAGVLIDLSCPIVSFYSVA